MQQTSDASSPTQHPITIAPRASLATAIGCIRCPVLRISAIGMDEDTAGHQLDGLATIQAVEHPPDAVGTEVEAEAKHLPSEAELML